MSHRAVSWALELKFLKPGPWVVLLKLADRHNKDTRRCDPDQKLLATDCNMSRATINRHLDELEGLGLIQRIKREHPVTGFPMSTFYILGLDADDPPEVEHAVSQIDTEEDEGESEAETAGEVAATVSKSDSGPLSQKTGVHCLKKRDSTVSLLRHKPVIKPVKEPYAGASAREGVAVAAPADLDKIAESWVEAVKAGRTYVASTISFKVARRMLERGLVTSDELKAVGIHT